MADDAAKPDPDSRRPPQAGQLAGRKAGGDESAKWGNYVGYGLQMAVGVGLGVMAGLWIDGKWNVSPWGVIVGSMLGLTAGMYLLIKDAIRINRD